MEATMTDADRFSPASVAVYLTHAERLLLATTLEARAETCEENAHLYRDHQAEREARRIRRLLAKVTA
jgi:hypothetical protein